MKGFVVRLREDGLFEAKTSRPGGSDVRVTHDASSLPNPWTAIAMDEAGVMWSALESFDSLDEALDYAVCAALGTHPVPEYRVVLPDGISFARPGRKSAEEVMASAGWAYVTTLIGFMMVTTPAGATPFDARAQLMPALEGTSARLGEVHLADSDEEGLHWCADVNIDYDGFVRIEDLEAEAKAAFAIERIPVIPHFDFRTRTNVAWNTTTVIEFPGSGMARTAA